MASKTGRRANAAVQKGSNAPVIRDDGSRWHVMDGETKLPAYLPTAEGVTRAEGERLATGLVRPAYLVEVGAS